MKKKVLSLIVSAVVGLTSLSTAAFASTSTGATKIGDIMTEKQVEISNRFLSQDPNLAKTINNLKSTSSTKTLVNGPVKGPAPKLTNYYTYFIASSFDRQTDTMSGYEYVNNKSTTSKDFNGTIYVGTMEIGYGRETAKFNGNSVSSYDSVPLDSDGDGIVDEFIDIWQLTGVTSGKFESSSTTTNGIGTPFYTSVYIR